MNNEKRVYNKTGFFKQGNRTKEEQKAFLRDYMREYMRKKRKKANVIVSTLFKDDQGNIIPCYNVTSGMRRERKKPGTLTKEERKEQCRVNLRNWRAKNRALNKEFAPIVQTTRLCRVCPKPTSVNSYYYCGDHYNKIEE